MLNNVISKHIYSCIEDDYYDTYVIIFLTISAYEYYSSQYFIIRSGLLKIIFSFELFVNEISCSQIRRSLLNTLVA